MIILIPVFFLISETHSRKKYFEWRYKAEKCFMLNGYLCKYLGAQDKWKSFDGNV